MTAGLLPPGWLPVIQLLGAVQGLFLAAVLAGSPANRTANRLLAVVMAAFSLDLAMAWVYATGFEASWPHVIASDFLLPFLYGPLLFLYARSIELGGRRLPARAWLHFAPFALLSVILIPFYAQSGAAKLAMRATPEISAWTPWLDGLNLSKLVYSLGYIILAFLVVRRHREAVHQRFSSDERIALVWLRNILAGGFAMWLLSTVVFLVGRGLGARDPLAGFSDIVSIALAAYVYAIGYLGLRQRDLASTVGAASPPAAARSESPDAVGAETGPEDGPRYERSGLTPDRVQALAEALHRAMSVDMTYREPELSLADLAARLGVPPHHLSEALNAGHGQNFYEFVNGYRVEAVSRLLANPSLDHLTILALAEDAGFASKSAFNATFRRSTGMTPSEYRKRSRGH